MARRDTSVKRESILDAALEVFQTEGYENASMDRIAEVAQASKRTVYNHFEGKERLFKAVIERFLLEVSALQAIDYNPDAELAPQLEAFAATKERVVVDPLWLGLTRVGLSVAVSDPDLFRDSLAQAYRTDNHLTHWLQAAAHDGKLEIPDAAFASEMFWAMIAGTIVWPQVVHGPMEARHIARLRREVIEMFLGRFRKSGE